MIDKYAKNGNINAFTFGKPKIKDLNFSFSGLKTSILNLINSSVMKNPNFINENLNDLCASIQHSIITILLEKVTKQLVKLILKILLIAGGFLQILI